MSIVPLTEEGVNARFREIGIPLPQDAGAEITPMLIARVHEFFQGGCLMVKRFDNYSRMSISGKYPVCFFKPFYVQNDTL